MKRILVAYTTLGYPSKERFLEFVSKAGKFGVDYLEIGIPPSFAKYDGPAIRRSYEHVKKLGIDTREALRVAAKNASAPIIALTYLDDYATVLNRFAEELSSIGIEYLLLPDLLIDYLDSYKEVLETLRACGVRPTLFVSSSMPDRLIEEVSKHSEPFLYLGIRPATGIPIPVDPVVVVRRVRKLVGNTLVVGFGLSIDDIANAVNAGADGIAVGTAIIEAIERGGIEEAFKLLTKLRGVLNEL